MGKWVERHGNAYDQGRNILMAEAGSENPLPPCLFPALLLTFLCFFPGCDRGTLK